MKFLIIYSHPNPNSFNQAILKTLDVALRNLGHDVRIRDLYKMKFDPILKSNEMAGFIEKTYPHDIAKEHEHIRWADVFIFISPIWWGSFTSLLRGYLDRVFSLHFAYTEDEKGPRGLLSDKKAYTINTIGAPEHVYEKSGMFKAMDLTLDLSLFQFCGIQLLGHKYFSAVGVCSQEERKRMLDEVKEIANKFK